MRRSCLARVATGCVSVLLALVSSLPAAPPAVTALAPAGMQRGTSAEIRFIVKGGTAPLTAVEMTGQLKLTPDAKGELLSAECPADVVPGLYWIRIVNAEGASKLLPLEVGLLPELQETEPNEQPDQKTVPVTLPAVMNGVLSKTDDVDTFVVPLEAGQTLVASLNANLGLGSPVDAILQLTSPSGHILAQNHDDHGLDPLLTWTAPATGAVHIRVFGFPSAPNSTIRYAGGAEYLYRLTLTTGPFIAGLTRLPGEPVTPENVFGWNLDDVSAIDPNAIPGLHQLPSFEISELAGSATHTNSAPGQLPLTRFGGLADPASASVTPLELKKGDSLRLRVIARGMHSLLDPVLTIRQGDKVQKVFDDISKDDLDIEAVWKSPADGQYELVVEDRYQHAGGRYFYALHAASDGPEVKLRVEADAFVGKAGQPVEIPVTIERLSGFAEEVRFRVEGLPDSLTVEPVVSEAKADSAKKVTLKISGSPQETVSCPFKIVGYWGPEENRQEKVVLVPLKITKLAPFQLWLTIPAVPSK